MGKFDLGRNPDQKAVAELITRIKADDNEAVHALIRWCSSRIMLKLRTDLSRYPGVWEDVFWEVIMALVKNIKTGIYHEKSRISLAAYTHGIVKNKISDARKKEFKNTLGGRIESSPPDPNKLIIPAPELRNDLKAFNRESKQIEHIVLICLNSLKKSHRAHAKVIELFYCNDEPLKKIAARLGISIQKVTDLKAYGLKKLRQCVEKYRD